MASPAYVLIYLITCSKKRSPIISSKAFHMDYKNKCMDFIRIDIIKRDEMKIGRESEQIAKGTNVCERESEREIKQD